MRKEFVVMRELLNRQELFDIMADMMMDRGFVYISVHFISTGRTGTDKD